MGSDPLQQFLVAHSAGCHTESCFHNILVGAIQTDTVDQQKSQHHMHANSFVAIHKGMVGN